MEEFIKSLSIAQLEKIKDIIDNELSKKKSVSKEHIIAGYKKATWTEKELKSIRKKYVQQQNKVRSNREYDIMQLEIDCIDCALEGFKICV